MVMPFHDLPLLTIGYSSLVERVPDIRVPARAGDVEVLVCVQGGQPPSTVAGQRVPMIAVPGFGVARSRNAAIEHACGRYLLFCDDDVTVNLDGVRRAMRHLQETGHALALGRALDPSGAPRKSYPRGVRPLSLINSAKAATYEMLVDLDQVRAKGLRFDALFGAGTPVRIGDEYVFIADLLRAGLAGDAVPWVFGTHPTDSSGGQWGTAVDAAQRAVVVNRVFGRWAAAGRLAFGVRNRARFGSPGLLLRFLTDRSHPASLGARAAAPSAAGPAPRATAVCARPGERSLTLHASSATRPVGGTVPP